MFENFLDALGMSPGYLGMVSFPAAIFSVFADLSPKFHDKSPPSGESAKSAPESLSSYFASSKLSGLSVRSRRKSQSTAIMPVHQH